MSITKKLSVLVLFSVLLSLSSLAVYIILSRPARSIEAERQILDKLYVQMLELEVRSAALLLDNFSESIKPVEEASQSLTEAFHDVEQLQVLPALSPEIQTAIGRILDLNSRFYARLGPRIVTQAHNLLTQTADSITQEGGEELIVWIDFIGLSLDPPVQNPVTIRYSVRTFRQTYGELSNALSFGRDLVDSQFLLIDAAIATELRRVTILMGTVIVLLILLTSIIALFVARKMAGPIKIMDSTVSVIASGDLRPSFELTTNDELGRLGYNLNFFLRGLRTTIHEIMVTSNKNVEMERDLHDSIALASSSSIEIEANISSISQRISGIDKMVDTALLAYDSMEGVIQNTSSLVKSQSSQQQSAAKTIHKVMNLIQSAGELTRQNVTATDLLVKETQHARQVFAESQKKVSEIADSISSIRNMADVIADISERTNLLSMNAAIEAARAGELGKGFAVVAGEIRNLSTASAKKSQDIGDSISGIIRKINEAHESREKTEQVFDAMRSRIQDLSEKIITMSGLVAEAQEGSTLVSHDVDALESGSRKSVDQTSVMMTGVNDFRKLILDLQQLSNEVTNNISEITQGLNEMVQVFQGAGNSVRTIGELGESLNAMVQKFTVDSSE
ncbi:methyl-accepting chemotaxis protein [Spirochaeta dissipatitropha]